MKMVVRLKDETHSIFKHPEEPFSSCEGKQPDFVRENRKVRIEIWGIRGFQMEGIKSKSPVKALKYAEHREKEGKKEISKMWVVATQEHTFHCYCLKGVEAVFLLAFNMRKLYLFRRLHHFREWELIQKSATKKLCDNLIMENYWKLLYGEG